MPPHPPDCLQNRPTVGTQLAMPSVPCPWYEGRKRASQLPDITRSSTKTHAPEVICLA